VRTSCAYQQKGLSVMGPLCSYVDYQINLSLRQSDVDYGIGQTIIFMVALWNRTDHYIFMLWFVYGRPM